MKQGTHNKNTKLYVHTISPLSKKESDQIWAGIHDALHVKSPYGSFLLPITIKKNMLSGLLITLMLALGAGGTAYASDSAVPGDILFPVDQTVENVRLAFTFNPQKKTNLRIRFAEERLEEVSQLLSFASATSSDDTNATSTASTTPDTATSTPDTTATSTIPTATSTATTTNSATSTPDIATSTATTTPTYQNREDDVIKGLALAAALLRDIAEDKSNDQARLKLLEVADKLSERANTLSTSTRATLKVKIDMSFGEEKKNSNSKIKIDLKTDEGKFKFEVSEKKDHKKDDKNNDEVSTTTTATSTNNYTSDDDDDDDDDDKDSDDSSDNDSREKKNINSNKKDNEKSQKGKDKSDEKRNSRSFEREDD